MTHKPILTIPSGAITKEEKKSIEEGGYIVIVTDEPEKIKVLLPNSDIDGIDMLNAAIVGLGDSFSSDGRDKFFKELVKKVKAKCEQSKNH